MPWLQTGATQYHAQLGLPDKGRAFKGLVACNNWDLEPLDLINDWPWVVIIRPLRYQSYYIVYPFQTYSACSIS